MGKRFFKQTIHDVDLRHKTVLVRVDYNVPLLENGKISDDLRIRASLPTLRYLLSQHCKIVLISHLGRPQGRDEKYSLAPVAVRLSELLQYPVKFVDDCVGDKVRQTVRRSSGAIILLENLRFYPEEEADDTQFARSIARASQADYFVQDGFAVVHRKHASTHEITMYMPGLAGDLVCAEYNAITHAMLKPKRPLVAIVGGAKVSDKIGMIHEFINKADQILIGGAMANTFLEYKGLSLGKSRVEPGQHDVIHQIYQAVEQKVGREHVDEFLLLPTDVAVAEHPDSQERREVSVTHVGATDMALDIGMQTIERYTAVLAHAGTIIWNGPVGLAEKSTFTIGSARLSLAIAQNKQALSVVGGGDTADFVLKWDGHDGAAFSHVSTGGGASLALMAGKKLPGIESLLDAYGLGVVH